MAEHMFAKCKQFGTTPNADTAEHMSDLFYEIGKQSLTKRNYEAAVKWLERSCDILGEQDLGMLSSEAGELRMCILQGLGKPIPIQRFSAVIIDSAVQAHLKVGTNEATNRAWDLLRLMETDYCDKMVVSLLKLELLSNAETVDEAEYYNGKVDVWLHSLC